MGRYTITRSALIPAPATRVYGIIADYRLGHPAILPPRYFRNFTVERGGDGAGTEIAFEMRAFGKTRRVRATVTEPEPGRVLVETDPVSGTVTTFTVVAGTDAGTAQVTIATALRSRGGAIGMVERKLVGGLLQRVYAEELDRLAAFAASSATTERRTRPR